MTRTIGAAIVAAAALGGCAKHNYYVHILQDHVILVKLNDPADHLEFSRDTFGLTQPRGVVSVLSGPRLELGQAEELGDFDTAVRVGLQTAEACARLPDHPAYKALLAKWKPRSKSIRTISFGPRCLPEPAAEDSAKDETR